MTHISTHRICDVIYYYWKWVVPSINWHPKPGHWWSQGRNFWAV